MQKRGRRREGEEERDNEREKRRGRRGEATFCPPSRERLQVLVVRCKASDALVEETEYKNKAMHFGEMANYFVLFFFLLILYHTETKTCVRSQ